MDLFWGGSFLRLSLKWRLYFCGIASTAIHNVRWENTRKTFLICADVCTEGKSIKLLTCF